MKKTSSRRRLTRPTLLKSKYLYFALAVGLGLIMSTQLAKFFPSERGIASVQKMPVVAMPGFIGFPDQTK